MIFIMILAMYIPKMTICGHTPSCSLYSLSQMVSLKPVQFLYPLIRSSWRMTSSMMKYNGTEIVTREKKKLVHKISDTRGPHMSTLLVMGIVTDL